MHALNRTLENNDCDFVDTDEMELENEEDLDTNSNVIESKLIGGPLFCVNLAPESEEQQIVECLAGKSVRTRCQLHPIILDFLYKEQLQKNYPLKGPINFRTMDRIQKKWGNISCTPQLQFFW